MNHTHNLNHNVLSSCFT